MLAAIHAALLQRRPPPPSPPPTIGPAAAPTATGPTPQLGRHRPVAGDNPRLLRQSPDSATTNNFPPAPSSTPSPSDSTAANFSLAGNAILLGGAANGSIVNNSTNTETLTLGPTLSNLTASLLFGGNHFINAAAGTIAPQSHRRPGQPHPRQHRPVRRQHHHHHPHQRFCPGTSSADGPTLEPRLTAATNPRVSPPSDTPTAPTSPPSPPARSSPTPTTPTSPSTPAAQSLPSPPAPASISN